MDKVLRAFFLAVFLLFGASFGAASGDKSSSPAETPAATPKALMQKAEQLMQQGQYKGALKVYTELREEHPTSSFNGLARLGLAEASGKLGMWTEAEGLYSAFVRLYPKHPQTSKARLGWATSLYKQLPKRHDRDLSLSKKAMQQLSVLLNEKSLSTELKSQAQALQNQLRNRLAEHELGVARFYERTKQYSSALLRYQHVLEHYGKERLTAQDFLNASMCAIKQNKPAEAQRLMALMQGLYPGHKLLAQVRQAYAVKVGRSVVGPQAPLAPRGVATED